MPLLSEGYPRAAAVSARLKVVESAGSTNADLVAAVAAHPSDWPHLSAIVTTDRRRGRGRLDRTWTAPAGGAMAVSVVVDAAGIPLVARGWIPLIAGVAMVRAVRAQTAGTAHAVELKWPNDVLVDGAKISGILAEVVMQYPESVVIGAGVNTKMPRVDLPVETAVSFAAIGLEADDDRLLADYLSALDERLRALAEAGGDAGAAGIRAEIESVCATLGSDVVVSLPDGASLRGRARRIDSDGRLVVDAGGTETAVSAGDIVHVR